jgi:hypothetical protein
MSPSTYTMQMSYFPTPTMKALNIRYHIISSLHAPSKMVATKRIIIGAVNEATSPEAGDT